MSAGLKPHPEENLCLSFPGEHVVSTAFIHSVTGRGGGTLVVEFACNNHGDRANLCLCGGVGEGGGSNATKGNPIMTGS